MPSPHMRKMFIVALFCIAGVLLLSSNAGFPQWLLGAVSPLVSAQGGARQLQRRGVGDEREQRFIQSRLISERKITSDDYDKALEQWNRLPRVERRGDKLNKAQIPKEELTTLTGTVWKPVGPMPLQLGTGFVAGRVHAIAVNPNNPNVIYTGMNIGGVWKTTDAGANWTSLFDEQPALGIGQPSAIAIDPNNTNTLYVGTNSRFQLSKGILKSTDGGGSWIVLGSGYPEGNNGNSLTLFQGQNVNGIIVEPTNSNLLYLASSRGLYRSIDGGQTWTAGTGTNANGNAQSLALDTSSPAGNRVLFAGVNGAGILRSNDGGMSWTPVLTTATAGIAPTFPPGSTTPAMGKVVLALAPPANPANPVGVQVVYASIQFTGQDAMGNGLDVPVIVETTNQGGAWTRRTATGLGVCQCGATMQIGVDPASPGNGTSDIIYWGGTSQFRSTDSGANFANISNGQHVDTRAEWAFVRQTAPTPTIVYSGNDGGIYRSIDNGATWTGTSGAAPMTINAGGFQTAMVYHMDIRRDAMASVTAGSFQDNGSGRSTPTMMFPLQWTVSTGGDGFDIAFDYVNDNTVYEIHNVSATADGVFRSTDSGSSFPTNITGGIPAAQLGIFNNLVNVDPNNAGFVYVSGSAGGLFQSQNATAGAVTFTNIQNFAGGASVGAVDVARGVANNVVAVANAGSIGGGVTMGNQVWVSTNALAATPTFTNITRNLTGGSISDVAFDPNDSAVIYAVRGAFGGGHVFRTTISGTAWTDISAPVDVPHNVIALDRTTSPTTIYVGTDLGVMRSINGGASWTTLDDVHFPNMPVTDLKINSTAGVLRASTFGRGVFELAAPSGPTVAINAENGLQFDKVCIGKSADLTLQILSVGTQPLRIDSVERILGSSEFTVLSNPGTPLTLPVGSSVSFTVRFTPTSQNPQKATIRVSTNDPSAPFYDLIAMGTSDNSMIVAPAMIDFGKACPGETRDRVLTIGNSGGCDLIVKSITSSSTEFKVVGIVPFPLVIPPGSTRDVTIQFMPMGFTPNPMHMATLTIMSNDPVTPNKNVKVTGTIPPPVIQAAPDPLDFGEVCLNTSKTLPLVIRNTGECNLTVNGISFNSTEFKLVSPPAFPFVIMPGGSRTVMVSFMPVGATGPRMATMTINSDDPVTPMKVVTLKGIAPVSAIAISGSMDFGEVMVGKFKDQFLNITNEAPCDLLITLICEIQDGGPIQMPSTEFDVIAPITPKLIPGGGVLPVQIRFKPQKKGPRTAKLLVFGYDPATSTILLMESFPLKGVGK